ncbi:hypothetical protein CN675_08810 [Bacillus toyonensis]|uniref:hypothetical protein n=1 Tax=Bacillus toyonensis TaxID=155322 RepID=UPI000BF06985|nr:hypothetical protein [Bacillus toyonensis]PEJ20492.1 hypothetical protein CN675_08810 [Bacillus toyonensis]PEP08196.1 hypothetical protein CN577_11720 [Bacillus toyonensis]
MDAKLQDRQLKYVLKNHILPEKKFDFNEFRTQEEFNDFQEGLNKFNALSEDEKTELFTSIQNGTYEL